MIALVAGCSRGEAQVVGQIAAQSLWLVEASVSRPMSWVSVVRCEWPQGSLTGSSLGAGKINALLNKWCVQATMEFDSQL